jgi:hypothetical protein
MTPSRGFICHMFKSTLILWAMLVSTAIPQSAFSTDDLEYGVPQEMPALDSSRAGFSATNGAEQPLTLNPVSQKSVYLPATRPRQIAMFRPAHEHDDLLKTLYGWSTIIEVELTSLRSPILRSRFFTSSVCPQNVVCGFQP